MDNGESSLSTRRIIVDAPYERIPVFVPEGAIIPFGPALQYTDEKPAEPITFYVYAGRDGSFLLYEDEGTNYQYEKGQYSTIELRYNDTARTLIFGRRNGSFKGMLKERHFRVVLVDKDHPRPLDPDNAEGRSVTYNGKETTVWM